LTLVEDAALAADLVREAGELAAQMRGEGLRTETKSSRTDLVTAADRAAERLITDHLAAFRPTDGVLGEEGASRAGSTARTWVIDPIDGTYNFVQGLTWWCSALALVEDGDVVLGAVYHPHDDVLYVGGPDLSPTRNGELIPPLADVPLGQACVATYLHPPHHPTAVGDAYRRMAAEAATLRLLGSGTLEAVAVAQGQLHLTAQHSVPDWDRLPGEAIIRGVGGVSRTVDAAGVTWPVMGAPTAVHDALAAFAAG
jgi:fructose-1,6-bisphosphatase/inositol monophosphatase family enzyme